MLDREIKRGQICSLLSLAAIKLLYAYKTSQIIVVSDHLNRLRGAVEVMTVLLEALNNS